VRCGAGFARGVGAVGGVVAAEVEAVGEVDFAGVAVRLFVDFGRGLVLFAKLLGVEEFAANAAVVHFVHVLGDLVGCFMVLGAVGAVCFCVVGLVVFLQAGRGVEVDGAETVLADVVVGGRELVLPELFGGREREVAFAAEIFAGEGVVGVEDGEFLIADGFCGALAGARF